MILYSDNIAVLDKRVYGAREKRQAILNSFKPISKPARKAGKRIQAGLVVIPSKPAPAPVVSDARQACKDILSAWQTSALVELPARKARLGF